jgi:pseudaminic acid synthase
MIQIADRPIGQNVAPFIIAEMSGNHNQSLSRALDIVDAAAKSGAHALKLQTYTAETITLDVKENEFHINDKSSLWNGYSLYELYKHAYTPWEWHKEIFNRAKTHGMICFSSPFDETAVDFLEELDVPAYKIASFENVHLPLIHKVATTGKPMIISTGLATLDEIEDAVSTARNAGCEEIILLKCTSAYPATAENSNILTLKDLRERFACETGLSDHTLGIGAAIAAVAHGASVIEKHFTLDRNDGGVDSAFSLDPTEMTQLVNESERAWQALGQVSYGATKQEKESLVFRRSLYIAEDMIKGDVLNENNLRCVRPGLGLAPKHLNQLLGLSVNTELKKGTPMTWDFVDKSDGK